MLSSAPNPLAAMFEGAPIMVARERRSEFEACLAQAAAHPRIGEIMAEAPVPMAVADDGFWPAADDWRAQLRPYVVQNGILLIPVRGILLHNFPWQLGNWATGYDYIWRAFQRGLEDGNVKGIALVIHSPGGLVAGNQVLVDRMFARRDEKPLRAFAQEGAYSAAYNIFAVAPYGLVSSTGGVGSIGVMTCHIDWSKWNEQAGLKYTFIFAGAHKVEGNAEEPLSDEAKARIQARIDELYDVFVSSVARGRGMDEKAVRDTEALTFTASQATSNGLADAIGSLDDALSAFADSLNDTSEGDDDTMTATSTNRSSDNAVTAERTRISAILQSAEATGRGNLANELAFGTALPAETAIALLAKAPAATDTMGSTSDPFAAAMDRSTHPGVGGDIENSDSAHRDGADIIALARQIGIPGVRPRAASRA